MAKYFLTNKAVNDLTLIWDYTAEQWSEKQADKYYNEIIHSCKTIAENKYLGKEYSEIFPNLLSYRINKHVIFFRRINPDFVEITRILHEQMDFINKLLEQ